MTTRKNTTPEPRRTLPAYVLTIVDSVLEKYRIAIADRPAIAPVLWSGYSLPFEAADEIVARLEAEKLTVQKRMNNSHLGGEVTKVAGGALGGAAMVAGLALLVFPPTALAGVVTLASGAGAALISNGVGDGVSKVGTNHAVQRVQQIDAYVRSIKDAQVDAARRLARAA
jgi:hypothetical protein